MNIFEAILLGAVEGFTEFLPISSTGHLTIVEKLLGYQIDAPDITAFTAIIQSGAVIATVIFLRKDIARIISGWVRGILNKDQRDHLDYKFGWAVILGSVPIGIVRRALPSPTSPLKPRVSGVSPPSSAIQRPSLPA